MARNLKSNGPGHNIGAAEKPYFDRLVAIETHIRALREDRKVIKTEAREADVKVGPLDLAVKLYLESDEARVAREEKEAEAERILRALGEFVHTPLGEAAVQAAEHA
jgi:hypothetical protein